MTTSSAENLVPAQIMGQGRYMLPVNAEIPTRRKRSSRENEQNDNNGRGSINNSPTDESSRRVLVMVKDERTLDSVRSYLVDGREVAITKRGGYVT